jgi:hypothetical protein
VAVAVPAESSVLLEIGEKEEENKEEEELAPATVSVSNKQVPTSVTICEGC